MKSANIHISKGINTVCFDFGNTLIEFGPRQISFVYQALEDGLRTMFGECDATKLKQIRDRQIVAPYKNGYKENNLITLCEELIEELYDVNPEQEHIDMLFKLRYESFVEVVEIKPYVIDLLNHLKQKYTIGLLSNYPCGDSIRDALKKLGIYDLFDTVVVSGDVGYIKPHPLPFQVLLDNLSIEPSEAIYVGDNWLADIQGAKSAGMQAVYITQHKPYEKFEPQAGDIMPDAEIKHLLEIKDIL